MPGVHTRCKPLPASETSVSDEALQLERYLQRELEDDIARIFDESLYSDLEVVCGKLKILTHSCILKARTNNFHQKLQTILHINIERDTFDEIYSFVSDIYTECNVKHQETEILSYLKNKICQKTRNTFNAKEDTEESEVFLTPKCLSPFSDKASQKTVGSSPSTELTREYYALVPIEATQGSLLDKELLEQDVLSDAFHSIIKCQTEDLKTSNSKRRTKPTSLSLSSSHISKTVKHSNSCGFLNKNRSTDEYTNIDPIIKSSLLSDSNLLPFSNGSSNEIFKNYEDLENTDKLLDSAYSPDSLAVDDLSSSSDYLSAAYTFSPGKNTTVFSSQLNVGNSFSNMENILPSSDSGLENTGLLESLGSHKDVTLDVSLTESTLQDINSDEANISNGSSSSPFGENNHIEKTQQSCNTDTPCEKPQTSSHINQLKYKDCVGAKTSKDEKQRQNEEIINLESSSLSSETGSWESVFPPNLTEKNVSQKFINNERQNFPEVNLKRRIESNINYNEELCPSLVQKSPFKSTSCFIDAASLVDGEDESIKVYPESNEVLKSTSSTNMPAPSEPVPCSTVKPDISPNEWSQSIDNDDSLEKTDKPDPDSIQKDLSPTLFEMTPITEDSLSTNVFEIFEEKDSADIENERSQKPDLTVNKLECHTSTVIVSSTPNNSIMSLRASALRQYESEESETDMTIVGRDGVNNMKLKKYNESSPIVSGGASIEDHLPQIGSYTSSPMIRRKIDNTPIVSGAYIPEIKENKQRKPIKPVSASAWVVDMCSSGSSTMSEGAKSVSSDVKQKEDRVCEHLRAESNNSKSRSSVDSDSSERSSHKFYIDLSSLPDTSPPKKNNEIESNEKKNIFSMYIDLGEKSSLKNMPARLSSSLNAKKESLDCRGSPKTISELKDKKPKVTDTPDIKVFEKYETLCNNPDISITEIIKFPKEDLKVGKVEPIIPVKDNIKQVEIEKFSRSSGFDRSYQRSTPQVIQEESFHEQSGDLFVKLSDLDKTSLPKTDLDVKVSDVRMTRSIPDNNWGDSNHSPNSRPMEVISSFHSENALSLNRLFPHLKNEFSRSMPGSLSGHTRSPFRLGVGSIRGDLDEAVSDVSEISSVQSSTCRSVVEHSTTEESSQMSGLIGNCQSRLGQDLLRMFLEEIAPDVIVEVSGRRIKAHKCILSSRCQYFAGILSGGWVESAGNVIVLPPFSFNVVHFALCHIYSGVSTIPDTISIVELATIADMLGLEGLKEAIMFTLKAKYCHHFHKPCPVCTAGVLECFPLSSVYGLDDLYRKCLRWITKYFTKVWPTKAFATLPKELLDKCYQQHIINLTLENFVETVYGCGITVTSLQNSRWSESVARMCRRLVNAAAHFAAPRLETVLKTVIPVAPDTPPQAKQALDDCLAAAIVWAPPDVTCRAYAFLSAILKDSRNRQPKPDLITRGKQNDLAHTHAGSWRLQCEGALVRLSPRVVATRAFKDLPPDLRSRLRELGCIMFDSHEFTVSNPPVVDCKSRSYHGRADSKDTTNTRSLDIDHVRASFVPYTPKPAIISRNIETLNSNNDLRDKKSRNNPPVIRTTKAQQERAKFNLTKNNSSQDALNGKLAMAGARRANKPTKSRISEPKTSQDDGKRIAPKKLVPRIFSSSESSRNTSPIQSRNLRTSRAKTKPPQTMSQDSLATTSRPRTAEPSTDSLTESQNSNKYATYTKVKHTAKGSFESIKSSKGQTSSSTVTSKAANNKMKTKIPVYVNQPSRTYLRPNRSNLTDADRRPNGSNGIASSVPVRTKQFERKIPGSLMNATKASSAKMVPKIVKDAQVYRTSKTKGGPKQNTAKRDCPPEIPIMERSGTFLKDEPTFGEITTKNDIDK